MVASTYTYDENGNRTQVNGVLVGHYDAQDRLLDYQGTTYTYTPNGELTSKTEGAFLTTYEEFSIALEVDRNSQLSHGDRAFALGEIGNHDLAIENLTNAIQVNPKESVAYNNRGFRWYEKSEYGRALADFNTAIEIDPRFAPAHSS